LKNNLSGFWSREDENNRKPEMAVNSGTDALKNPCEKRAFIHSNAVLSI
jgi:hypothetical protein